MTLLVLPPPNTTPVATRSGSGLGRAAVRSGATGLARIHARVAGEAFATTVTTTPVLGRAVVRVYVVVTITSSASGLASVQRYARGITYDVTEHAGREAQVGSGADYA